MKKLANRWVKKNWYYHQDLINFYKFNVLNNSNILAVGCNLGYLLDALSPKVAIEISEPEGKIDPKNKFDYVIFPDSLANFFDVQSIFHKVQDLSQTDTRIIINYHSFLWLPILSIAEKLSLKSPQNRCNWLNTNDLINLLTLENFQIIKCGKRFLFPIYIPLISNIVNKYIARLPIFSSLCITNYIIARPLKTNQIFNRSVSIIIPARNEKGNIENAVKRMPKLNTNMEIIFIEGHSRDETFEEIKRVARKYRNFDIKYSKQDGEGKAEAVRKGFLIASKEILIILDADLSVDPKDLTKFYEAISSGKAEFINGSRLVYPIEKDAMRGLNILGNKFFSIIFSWLLNQPIKDTLCGTKALSKASYDKLVVNRCYFGNFDPFGDFDLIFGASKLNLKFIEVPIRYHAREYGSTNISRIKHGWLLLKMVWFALGKIKFV